MLRVVSNNPNSADTASKTVLGSRWLFFFCMLYITVLLLSTVLVHKMMRIGEYSVSAGTFVFPFSYLLGDVIAEVYGYQFSRRLIWASLCCLFIFDMGSGLFAHTVPPSYWSYEKDYLHVLGPLPRIFIGDLIGINAGAFVNVYALTKWKILTKGRFFGCEALERLALAKRCLCCVRCQLCLLVSYPFRITLKS